MTLRLRHLLTATGALAVLGGATAQSAISPPKSAPVVVRTGDFFYLPKVATVRVGQQLIFKNVGKAPHTVANTDARGTILSTLIKPRQLDRGDTQRVVFKKPGLVRYICTFHPTLMRGQIKVVAG